MYSTSSIFLQALSDAGITHLFVNWGSDHPALLEELQRQRAQSTDGKTACEIVTCPNEMVALSAAQGYAQISGELAAVIVHVDVGTLALAGAIHNVDRSRTPVLIYSGASPFSSGGELKGGRNEWIMSIQGGRLSNQQRSPIERPTFTRAASIIAEALCNARSPLIITSHSGRSPASIPLLSELASTLAIPIVAVCPSAVPVPFSHPCFLGTTFLNGATHNPRVATADVVLVLDSDIPWISSAQAPSESARIFVIDSGDPLKTVSAVGQWHVDAELMCNADTVLALQDILSLIAQFERDKEIVEERRVTVFSEHESWLRRLDTLEGAWPEQGFSVPNILGVLRKAIESQTTLAQTVVLNESISSYTSVWDHMRTEVSGGQITSGGSSLGWALGAGVGAKMTDIGKSKLVVLVVGDGSFLFGVPSSAYWMARRYDAPFLTVVLNNGGWKSPKLSMLACHPQGHGSMASGADLSVGFGPYSPEFAQIAVAASAGWAWGKKIAGNGNQSDLEKGLAEAVRAVIEERRCAVVDCVLESV
ncbi:unnamed protein product [Mycena citricolor]|uniref:Uncharacterized protein n=1 Tax=Mycena citricolor TaxID=2018698 RepID=A0AAD2JXR6_9AGAR|nr:unnamed protein product [Mycena citricolor]